MSLGGLLETDMATMRGWLVTGLRWWQAELADMVPRRWREVRIGELAVYGYDPELGELALRPTASGALPRPDLPAAVVLPPQLTLIRSIDYPAVSERDLASLIELDRDRIMPQGRDVVLAARVLARDPASGRMQVEVAGLPMIRAQALAATLMHSPTAPPRLPVRVLAGMPGGGTIATAAGSIDMLPALRRAGLIGGVDRSPAPLWYVVAFLFLLNLGLLVWRDSASLDTLSAAVDQQQPALGVAHSIIGRMHRDERIAQQTIDARRNREPVALITRIGRALPPGTFIQRLSWQSGRLQLAGYHPPHADVSGALRRAGLAVTRYGDASDEAPTTMGEPFEVTIKLGAG